MKHWLMFEPVQHFASLFWLDVKVSHVFNSLDETVYILYVCLHIRTHCGPNMDEAKRGFYVVVGVPRVIGAIFP